MTAVTARLIGPLTVLVAVVAVVAALCIFSLTFLTYADAHARREIVGYMPMSVGVGAFAVTMTAVNLWALRGEKAHIRFGLAAGMAAIETFVFWLVLLFLLLNSFGS
jgi:hypothetical protein